MSVTTKARAARLALAAATALALMPAAHATTLKKEMLVDAAAQSQAIVIAEALESHSERIDGQIYTLTTFKVSETVQGSAGQTVTVATPGGRDTSRKYPVSEVVAGSPRFIVGQKQCLMLQGNGVGGAMQVVGFNQGLFDVEGSGEELRIVLPDGALTVDEFRAAIAKRRTDVSQ
ncbi:MAG: hypothetical protein ACFB22_09375 [Rhodothalassiaceae bacterium]